MLGWLILLEKALEIGSRVSRSMYYGVVVKSRFGYFRWDKVVVKLS